MAWSAELIRVERKGAMTYPTVRFSTDEAGITSFEETFQGDDINPDSLAKLCKRRVNQLSKRDTEFQKFAIGPIDLSRVVFEEVPVSRPTI